MNITPATEGFERRPDLDSAKSNHQVQNHRHHGTFRPREVNHVPRRSSKGASVAKVRRGRCHQTPQPRLAPGTEPELPKLSQTQKLNAGT